LGSALVCCSFVDSILSWMVDEKRPGEQNRSTLDDV
jgi:hypothetical protein